MWSRYWDEERADPAMWGCRSARVHVLDRLAYLPHPLPCFSLCYAVIWSVHIPSALTWKEASLDVCLEALIVKVSSTWEEKKLFNECCRSSKELPRKNEQKNQQLGLLPNLQCTSTQPQMDQRQKSTIESKNQVLCKFAKKNSVYV